MNIGTQRHFAGFGEHRDVLPGIGDTHLEVSKPIAQHIAAKAKRAKSAKNRPNRQRNLGIIRVFAEKPEFHSRSLLYERTKLFESF